MALCDARAKAGVGLDRKQAEIRDADRLQKSAGLATCRWMASDVLSRRQIRLVVNRRIGSEYRGAWDEVCAWYFDKRKQVPGDDQLFPGGFGQIIRLLAREPGIRASVVVTSLAPGGEGAGAILAAGEMLFANHVTLTVPLGPLVARYRLWRVVGPVAGQGDSPPRIGSSQQMLASL